MALKYDSMEKKADKPKDEKPSEAAPKADAMAKADTDGAKAADPAPDAKADPRAKQSEARKSLLKTHMAERKDMHGRHKDELTQMHARHEKAIEEMHSAHDLEMVGDAPKEAEQADVAPAAVEEANAAAGNE